MVGTAIKLPALFYFAERVSRLCWPRIQKLWGKLWQGGFLSLQHGRLAPGCRETCTNGGPFHGGGSARCCSVMEVSGPGIEQLVVLQVHEGPVLLSNLVQSAVLDLRAKIENSPIKFDSVKSRVPRPSRGRCAK